MLKLMLPEGDEHEFSDEWYTLDGEYHWRECECGFTTDRGAHEFVYVMDSEPTPTVSGWKHKECTVCGKKGPKIEVYYDEFVTTPEDPEEPENPGNTTPPADDNDGLGTGAVIGIVAGAVAVLAIGGFSLVWFVIKKKTLADLLKK